MWHGQVQIRDTPYHGKPSRRGIEEASPGSEAHGSGFCKEVRIQEVASESKGRRLVQIIGPLPGLWVPFLCLLAVGLVDNKWEHELHGSSDLDRWMRAKGYQAFQDQ